MLSNAYFLAKFRFDTAENEPAKDLQNFANFPNFANPKVQAKEWAHADALIHSCQFLANFGKMLLVFGCIGTDFCK